MSMAWIGLTHCPKCGNPYKEMSFTCEYCEAEENEIKQTKLDMLLSLDNNEIEYLIEIAKKGGKEIKNNKINKQIEELKKELEEN